MALGRGAKHEQARNGRSVDRSAGLSLSPLPGGWLDAQLLVYSGVQVSNHFRHRDLEHFADAQEGGDGDGSSRFNLLPGASGESERNHILLAVAALLAKLTGSLAQGAKEFSLIHTPVCSLLRAD